jgi:hypothetical protein
MRRFVSTAVTRGELTSLNRAQAIREEAEEGTMEPGEASRPDSAPPPGAPPVAGVTVSGPPPPPTDAGRHPISLVAAAAAVVLVVAAGLAFGLPGGSKDGAPLTAIAQAALRTGDVSGARFSGTGTGSGSGFGMQMSFEGAYNTETNRSEMRMETTTPGAPLIAAGMNPMVAVQDGLTMYMSSPAFSTMLPSGKRWMKIEVSEFGAEPLSGQVDAVDARAILSQLESVGGNPQAVGREKVRGVGTTHYTAELDPALPAEQLREAGNDLAADVLEGQDELATVDVWIDREGLIRRTAMQTAFQLPGQAGGSMSMTIDFYDFGAAPKISVPADTAAFDVTSLALEGLQSAAQ